MNDSNTNGPVPPKGVAQADKSGDTITVTCDELVEFEENGSQPANTWPWPEPPFGSGPQKLDSRRGGGRESWEVNAVV